MGVARRIANQIADIGERLESVDDRKRNNRLAKRNARMQRLLARQQKPGLLERGARGVAEALDGRQAPQQRPRIPVQQQRPQIPMQPPQLSVADIDPVSPRPRRRRGNLRESEQRRMERELVEPMAHLVQANHQNLIDQEDDEEPPHNKAQSELCAENPKRILLTG